MKNIMKERMFNRGEHEVTEDGFSLLELVIAIGIILILTVGGLIGYSAIQKNSKQAAVESAVSAVATAAVVYDSDPETNGSEVEDAGKNWNESAKDDSIVTESKVVTVNGQRCIQATATHRDGFTASRSTGCAPVSDDDNSGGEVVEALAAPILTKECEARPGLLGLGARVRIVWKPAEGYGISNTEFVASTSGMGSPLASIDGFSLSGNTTSNGDGTFTTDIPTNLLGGLLGLGEEIEIALRTVDGEKVSDTASVATNGGLLAGIEFSCRNL